MKKSFILSALVVAIWTFTALESPAQTTPNILFVGNSFTHGQIEPTHSYNNANVFDSNINNFGGAGGIPGIFKKMAADLSYPCNVTIEAVSSQTLAYHFDNQQPTIDQSKWQLVILQDYSTEPTTTAGDVAAFDADVFNLRNLIMTANPNAKIFLYETWARPDICSLGSGSTFPSLAAMLSELRTNYFNANSTYNLQGVVPVGEAFAQAITDGYGDSNPINGIDAGKFNLWASDNYHPSIYGAYMDAAVFFAKITGIDPRTIPTGVGSAAAGLGISSTDAAHLNTVAYEVTATAPAITSANATTFATSQGRSFTFAATGLPAPTFSATGLPAWATLNSTTGVISGTAPNTTGSPFTITLTAANGVGSNATQSFTLTVAAASVPTITNSPSGTGTFGNPYSTFTFATTGAPTPTFSVSSGSLPPGLSLSSTGVLSGVPWVTGAFSGVVSAANGNGTATQTVNITIQQSPYFLNGPPPSQIQVNTAYTSFNYQAAGYPGTITYGYTGSLPSGMTLNSGGLLFGTPTSTGTYNATVNASNGVGSAATQTLTIIVSSGVVSQIVQAIDCGSAFFSVSSDGTPYSADQYFTSGTAKDIDVLIEGTNDPDLYASYRSGTCSYAIPVANGSYFVDLKFGETEYAFPGDRRFNVSIQNVPVLSYFDISALVGQNEAIVETFPATVTNGILTINVTDVLAHGLINAIVVRTQEASHAPAITNTPTVNAVVGTPYGFAYQATGSPAPTFNVTSGNMPNGLSLSPTGLITGRPITAGTYTGVVTAGNGIGTAATSSFTIMVLAPTPYTTTITSTPPASLPKNVGFTYTYTYLGYPAPTFNVTSGAMPTGLTLSSAGTITGTPTVIGTYAGVVTANNGVGSAATASFSIKIFQQVAPTITNTATGTAALTIPYSFTYSATGAPTATFSVSSGNLPPGLFISPAGVISGTPGSMGTYTGVVTADNGVNPAATSNFSIAVAAAPAPGGERFNFGYNATGIHYWNSLTGYISGSAGSSIANAVDYNTGLTTAVGISVTSSFTFAQSYGVSSSLLYPSPIQLYGFAVNSSTTGVVTLTGLDHTKTYDMTIFGSQTGGFSGVVNYTINGTLQTLSIHNNTSNTLAFNGVSPDASGHITMSMTSGTNNTGVIQVLTISPPNALPGSPTISGAPTSPVNAGAAYSYTFSSTGTPTLTFSITSGGLPPGLTLNPATGGISGTVTSTDSGSYAATATVANSIATASETFTISVNHAPSITNTATGTAVIGSGYNFSYSTTGYPAPTFHVSSGSLPSGLTLSTSGVILGTPNGSPGISTGVVTATNVSGSATSNFSINVLQIPTITGTAPNGTVGTAYSFTYTATGTPTPTFAVSGGTLPAGLSLNSASGVISGTPTMASTSTGTIAAINSAGSATTPFNIAVTQALVAPTISGSAPAAIVSVPYSFAYTATGYPAPTFNISSGSLPAGLSFSTSLGTISGSPTTVGTSTGTVTATNSSGSASIGFSITVASPGQQVNFNFEPTSTTTPGGNWNTVTGYTSGSFSNAKDFNLGTTTGIGLSVTSAFTFATNYGVPSTALYTSPAQTYGFATNPATTGVVTVNGLNTGKTYTLVVFGSGSGRTGTGLYTIGTTSQTLTIGGNSTSTIAFSNVAPDGLGHIALSVAAGTCNIGELSVLSVISSTSAGGPTISGTPTSPVNAGAVYSYTFSSTGTPTLTFGITSGSLPPGLTLSASTGTIAGTATSTDSGPYVAVAAVSNASGNASTSAFTIAVNHAPAITNTATATATTGTAYSFTYTATGYPAPTFNVSSGSLPTGLSLSPAGVITGTPATAGTATGVVSATNGIGSAATSSFTIIVASGGGGGGLQVNFNFEPTSTATPSGNWNTVTGYSSGSLANVKDFNTGSTTTVGIAVTSGFSFASGYGSISTLLYPSPIQSNSFAVGHNAASGVVTVSGLDSAKTYSVTVFGSDTGSSGPTFISTYTIGSTTLNYSNDHNTTTTAVFSSVTPDGTGHIALSVNAGTDHIGSLGALIIHQN